MSRESEKIMREMFDYINAATGGAENASDEEINELIQQFMDKHNREIADQKRKPVKLTYRNAKTADDWLELADRARTEKTRRKYLENARKLEPKNLDILLTILMEDDKSEYEYVIELEKLLEIGKKDLKERKLYTESMGDFWLVLETRPYMRVYDMYIKSLIECHMMKRAIAEAEEVLRLNKSDNLGMRYTLMALYVYMEDEKKALKFMSRYPDERKTIWFQYPMAFLYFKEEKFREAKRALKIIAEDYPDFPEFMSNPWAFINKYDDDSESYTPFEPSEIIAVYDNSSFLNRISFPFYTWLKHISKEKTEG